MILQLNPPIPLITPEGKGLAHFIIDYSAEFDILWVVFLDKNSECWTFKNPEIRIQKNFSLGRHDVSPIPGCLDSGHVLG